MSTLQPHWTGWDDGSGPRYTLSVSHWTVLNGFLSILLTTAVGSLLHLLILTLMMLFKRTSYIETDIQDDQMHVAAYNAATPGRFFEHLLKIQWTYNSWGTLRFWTWGGLAWMYILLGLVAVGVQIGGILAQANFARSGYVPLSGEACGRPIWDLTADAVNAFVQEAAYEVPLVQDYLGLYNQCEEIPATPESAATTVICPSPKGGQFNYTYTVGENPGCWSNSKLESSGACHGRWRHISQEATLSLEDMGVTMRSEVELTARSHCDQINASQYSSGSERTYRWPDLGGASRLELTVITAAYNVGELSYAPSSPTFISTTFLSSSLATRRGAYLVTFHTDGLGSFTALDDFRPAHNANEYSTTLVGIDVSGVETRGINTDTLFGVAETAPGCNASSYCPPAIFLGVLACWDDFTLRRRDGSHSVTGSTVTLLDDLLNPAWTPSQKHEAALLLQSSDPGFSPIPRSIRALRGLVLNASSTLSDGNQYRVDASAHEEVKRWFGLDVMRRLSWAQTVAGLPAVPESTYFQDFKTFSAAFSPELVDRLCHGTLFPSSDYVSVSVGGVVAEVVLCLLFIGLCFLDGLLLRTPRRRLAVWIGQHSAFHLHRLAFHASDGTTAVSTAPKMEQVGSSSGQQQDSASGEAMQALPVVVGDTALRLNHLAFHASDRTTVVSTAPEMEQQVASSGQQQDSASGEATEMLPMGGDTALRLRRTVRVNHFGAPQLEGPQPAYGLSVSADFDGRLVPDLGGKWSDLHHSMSLAD